MIKHDFPRMQFDKISDQKHDMYPNGKLFKKLLMQATNKDNKSLL